MKASTDDDSLLKQPLTPQQPAPFLRQAKERPAKNNLEINNIPASNNTYTLDPRLLKLISLAVIVTLLLIPLMWVEHWLDQRELARQDAINTVTERWGGAQTIVAPLLIIPYSEHITQIDSVTDKDGETRVVSKDIYNSKTAIFLPETLAIAADLKYQEKPTGILQNASDAHKALVYDANISLTGRFDHSSLQETASGDIDINWAQARVVAGLSDTQSLDESSFLRWGEENSVLEPGTGIPALIKQGVHAPLDRTSSNDDAHDFKLTLKFRGSDTLTFAPLGRLTTLRITSPWQQPEFKGNVAPQDYDITEQGFSARWEMPHLIRDYPQHWIQNASTETADTSVFALDAVTAGVALKNTTSPYQTIEHALRYAVLFIVLSLAVFFALEQLFQRSLYSVHYLIVGAGLVAFYPLLLTLADHLSFMHAYSIAAASIIMLLGLYTGLLFKQWGVALLTVTLLTSLYALFYLMQLQPSSAALIAVLLGLGALALVMLATRTPVHTGKH